MTNQVPAFSQGFRLQWEAAQDSFVLLYPEGMIKLNPAASEILNLVDGERDVEAIIQCLQEKFPDADLRADVLEFIDIANNNNWLTVTQSSA